MDPERAQALLLKAAEKHVDLTPHPSSQICARATPSSTGHLRSVCVCVRVCVRACVLSRTRPHPTPPHYPTTLLACVPSRACACLLVCVRMCVCACVVCACRAWCVCACACRRVGPAGWLAGLRGGQQVGALRICVDPLSRVLVLPWPVSPVASALARTMARWSAAAGGEGTRRVRACVRACVLSRTRPHPIHFSITLLVCVPSCACVPACVRAYVRARMRACVRACVVRPRVRVSARWPGGRTGGPAGPGSALASSPGSWCCPGRSRQWPVPWPGCRWLRVVRVGGYGARHEAQGHATDPRVLVAAGGLWWCV